MTRATYTQTQVYLKPLMRKLKKKNLPEDICDSLMEITKHLLERNYIMVCKYIVLITVHKAVVGLSIYVKVKKQRQKTIFENNIYFQMSIKKTKKNKYK